MGKFRDMLLNELKLGSQVDKYLELIKKGLHSEKMTQNEVNGNFEVEYDNITLVIDKSGYLIGFKENEEYYEVSKNLKSIKDLHKGTKVQQFLGRKVGKIDKTPEYSLYIDDSEYLRNIEDIADIIDANIDTGEAYQDKAFNLGRVVLKWGTITSTSFLKSDKIAFVSTNDDKIVMKLNDKVVSTFEIYNTYPDEDDDTTTIAELRNELDQTITAYMQY